MPMVNFILSEQYTISQSSLIFIFPIYFNNKMASKLDRSANKSTSITVLKQLQQNESLRIEIFRLRTDMRDQHHHFLNSTINQEMLVQKMLTELCLAYRRGKETRQYKQQHEILSNAVKRCINNLQDLLQAYNRLKDEWNNIKQQDPALYYQQLLEDCSLRFGKAEKIIQRLNNQNHKCSQETQLKNTQIQFLQEQLGKNQRKYQEVINQNKLHKAQIHKLSQKMEKIQGQVNSLQQRLQKANKDYDEVYSKMKESRQTINKKAEYLHSKYENIQRENDRLVQLQRDYTKKQQQLYQTVDDKNNQIHSLKQEIQRLKTKFRQIIDKEDKIKHLEKVNYIKTNRPALSQLSSTQNTIDSVEQRPLKRQVGKMTKKFNLQSFQEKIIFNSNSSATFYLQ